MSVEGVINRLKYRWIFEAVRSYYELIHFVFVNANQGPILERNYDFLFVRCQRKWNGRSHRVERFLISDKIFGDGKFISYSFAIQMNSSDFGVESNS